LWFYFRLEACSDCDPRQSITRHREIIKRMLAVFAQGICSSDRFPDDISSSFVFFFSPTVKAIHKPVGRFIKTNMHAKPHVLYNAVERWARIPS